MIKLLLIFVFGTAFGVSNAVAQPTIGPIHTDDFELQCIVRLRVEFLESGKIGEIKTLPESTACTDQSLIDQAVKAASTIKFTQKMVDGKPVTAVKQVEYTFSAPYDEGSPKLAKNAVIKKQPQPIFPKNNSLIGSVKVELLLRASGKIEIPRTETSLPVEFRDAAVYAARKIRFNPAIRKEDGRKVSQYKSIIYEVKPN